MDADCINSRTNLSNLVNIIEGGNSTSVHLSDPTGVKIVPLRYPGLSINRTDLYYCYWLYVEIRQTFQNCLH